jgi:hypothetical protein
MCLPGCCEGLWKCVKGIVGVGGGGGVGGDLFVCPPLLGCQLRVV